MGGQVTETVTVRVPVALITEARTLIPSGDALTVQAVVDHLLRAGIGAFRAGPADPLTTLQSAGRAASFPCGLVLVAHWIDDNRRSLVAIGHGGWSVPVHALPEIVRAVQAAGTEEEAVQAICGMVDA